jgi:hypothetical protein
MNPLDARVQERVVEQWKVDPTAAMFNAQKIREEEKAKTGPQFYSRRGSAARRKIQAWERSRPDSIGAGHRGIRAH